MDEITLRVHCIQNYEIASSSKVKEAEVKEAKFVLRLCLIHKNRWGFYSSRGNDIVPFSWRPFNVFGKLTVYFQHEQIKDKIFEDLRCWKVCLRSASRITDDVCGIWDRAVQAAEKQNSITEIQVGLIVETRWVYEEFLQQLALLELAQADEFTITSALKSAGEAFERGVAMSEDCSSACTICTEGFVEGEEVIKMPCEHLFHSNCILPWLENNNSCPNCRAKI